MNESGAALAAGPPGFLRAGERTMDHTKSDIVLPSSVVLSLYTRLYHSLTALLVFRLV
jgi:hypothetical protein